MAQSSTTSLISTTVRLIKSVFNRVVNLFRTISHQAREDDIIYILLLILLVRVVFLITPQGPKVDFFLLADKSVHLETFIYFLYEHIAFIMICRILYVEVNRVKYLLKAFYWIAIGDSVDYVLTYNNTWVEVAKCPISFNTVSILYFALVIWKNR